MTCTQRFLVFIAVFAGFDGHATRLPFGDTDCEKYILGTRGQVARDRLLERIQSTGPILLRPTNHHLPLESFDLHDPGYAINRLDQRTLESIYLAKMDAHNRFRSFVKRVADSKSTPLSPLHREALGISASVGVAADWLFARLTPTAEGSIRLDTFDLDRQIGTVELHPSEAHLAYRGKPAYWHYLNDQDRSRRNQTGIESFMKRHQMLVFTPPGSSRPMAIAIQLLEPSKRAHSNFDLVRIDIFLRRRVNADVLTKDAVQIPTLRDGEGSGVQLHSIDLRMDRVMTHRRPVLIELGARADVEIER